MIAILVVIALLLVWLSLSMAATEGAVGRVTRASLNNLILEIQTDTEASQFIRDKKIKRIHKTSGSKSFASTRRMPARTPIADLDVNTLRSISETSGSKSFASTRRSMSDAEACRCGVGRGGFDAVR